MEVQRSQNFIYSLPQKMLMATVINRPSKINKSPYLADIIIDSTGEISIAHSPSLGCGGLICSGVKVYVVPCESKTKDKNVSKYILYHIENKEKIMTGPCPVEIIHSPICAHPNMANIIVGKMLEKKMIVGLEDLTSIKAESSIEPLVKIENFNEDCVFENEKTCRFDFSGILNDINILIEVKCVPLADYVDVLPKIRSKTLASIPNENKTRLSLKAIFPYGTARKYELVSPRALKHIKNLEAYTTQKGYKTFMIYITMRDDVEAIKISELDIEYRKAVFEAQRNGVNLLGYSIRWNEEKAYFNSMLPII